MLPPPSLLRSARHQLFLHRSLSLPRRTCYPQLWPRRDQMLPPPSLLRSARHQLFLHRSLSLLRRICYIRNALCSVRQRPTAIRMHELRHPCCPVPDFIASIRGSVRHVLSYPGGHRAKSPLPASSNLHILLSSLVPRVTSYNWVRASPLLPRPHLRAYSWD